jgi:hypothetical protein
VSDNAIFSLFAAFTPPPVMSTPFQALTPQRVDSPIYRLGGICDSAAANLLSVFTGFALIPIRLGATYQEIRGQPVGLLSETMSPEHHQRLAVSSIAVALGIGGLLAVLLDGRDHLMDFLCRNPVLGGTLITGHGATFVIWIVADRPHRRPLSTSRFSVVTEGKVMAFDRTATAKASYFLTVATPIKADLEALDWGPDPDGQIAAWLVSLRYGEFFRRNRRGATKANAEPWTAYLVKHLKPVLRCNAGDRSFEQRDGQSGEWSFLGNAAVVARIREVIRTATIGPETAKANINEKWILSMVLPGLRAALYQDAPLVDHFVALFADEAISEEKRANFTFHEFYIAYEQLRQLRGWPSFSPWDLGKAMRRFMAAPPRHKRISKSLARDNGNNDGFRGFAIHLPGEALSTGHNSVEDAA